MSGEVIRICPDCEPENPAARYADYCLPHRARDELPAHYIDCGRFRTYDYGLRDGNCDCTATADVGALVRRLDAVVALHSQTSAVGLAPGEWCPADGDVDPCPTLRAALGVEP